jgi:hypothetical protein
VRTQLDEEPVAGLFFPHPLSKLEQLLLFANGMLLG